jgi:class 3 adenylate cyclase/DNA-binding SARP family transcriptional activator
MDFRILGPLDVRDGDREVRLRGGKERALLALLLVNANRTLALDRIVDELWADDVPETAPKMVQIYVSHLRKALPPEMLHTRPPGYALVIEPDQLDLHRFEQLVAEARAALDEGRAEQAAESFRTALELWRGPALEEFASEPFAQPEAGRLEELRMNALEGRLEADLQRGRHDDVAGELEALVARYPLREGLRRQHMLALYRAGRQAEALAAYQDARRALADDLGIEPSPALRDLERRILQQDPTLDPAKPPRAPVSPEPPAAHDEEPAPEEMLKLVTVLFADVVGSTALVETHHPEDVRALMSDFFSAMSGVIEEQGGTIEKFVGDAIMAVFGVPTVHEDDAVRAVRAACRMLGRLRRWNDERDAAQALEIRIGVCTGEVLSSGAPGDDLRVTGEAVHVAARLQQAAEPGTILIADRTARFARSHFELRPLDGPLALRGKSEPLAAWLVQAPRTAEEPDGVAAIAAPLVGRDNELASLRTSLDQAVEERRPALVTIAGDAGVGKSRLLREFLAPLQGEAKVLIGRCLPYGESVTLWPLAEMLKGEALVVDTDSADTAAAKIAKLVETRLDPSITNDPGRTTAALASTLGLRLPDDPLQSLDPREHYRELIEAWRALLASIGRSFPVVAIVEDLHWADATMLDILEELSERLEGPILFLCTTRPDLLRSRPGWGGGRRNFSSLPLDPLNSEESARLAALLPGVDQLPDGVRRRILERSEGNPFFLEEIIRHLIDEGLLVQANGGWRSSVGIDQVEIPDNVQAVILARLELLSPEERRAAQRAAVVGRVFWDGALARLALFDDLDGALRTLSRREFVLERLSSSIPGQREYVFKHVLIRDVAYASLPRADRGPAHAETAGWIEEISGERADELAELLGHHYDAAFTLGGDDELRRIARTYLLTAAAKAYRRFAIQQGERLARRAVELSEGKNERVEALEALGDLHYLAFLGDAAWRVYTEALDELSDDDPALARLAGKATLFSARFIGAMHEVPEVDAVHRIIDRGLVAAPSPGPERTLLLLNRGLLLTQRTSRHDDAAEVAVREAAAAADELGNPDLLSAAFDMTVVHQEHRGRHGEAYRASLRRLELVPSLSDVKEVGDTYATAAKCAFDMGRYRESEERASACVEHGRDIDSGSYLHGLAWRVAARFRLGEWEAALADQAELERVASLTPRELPPGFSMGAYGRIGLCHALRGEYDDADRYIELVLRYATLGSFTRVRGRSIHLPPLALALARRERLDEALALIEGVPVPASRWVTLEARCELTALRERWDEAAELVTAARAEAEIGEQLTLPLFADRLEGRAAHVAGDLQRAVELLGQSAEGFAALEARWEEAWSRLLLAEVLAGSERGRAEQELAAALPVFETLGSVQETARARALLDLEVLS